MMFHIQPWMIVGLLPLSAAFEGSLIVNLDSSSDYFPTLLYPLQMNKKFFFWRGGGGVGGGILESLCLFDRLVCPYVS